MTTPTISRANIQQLNEIVRRPDVAPFVSAGPHATVTDIEGWDRMIPLTCGDGCMLFLETASRMYRADFLMVPGHRNNLRDARAMITAMLRGPAKVIWGPIAHDNPRSQRFAAALPAKLLASDAVNNLYAIKRSDWPGLKS